MRRRVLALLGGGLVLALLGVAMGARAADLPPRLLAERATEGPVVWRLASLPPVLDQPAVGEHLTTGLTTTFVFRLTTRDSAGERITGGAQIQVRYEPWDEVFHVAAVGIDGRLERRTLAPGDALADWWSGLAPVVLDGQRADLGGSAPVKLSLEVVPFSSTEQRDAQRWFSESLEKNGRSSAEEVAESLQDQPEQLGRAINLLLATSIQRRALATFYWTVARPALGPTAETPP